MYSHLNWDYSTILESLHFADIEGNISEKHIYCITIFFLTWSCLYLVWNLGIYLRAFIHIFFFSIVWNKSKYFLTKALSVILVWLWMAYLFKIEIEIANLSSLCCKLITLSSFTMGLIGFSTDKIKCYFLHCQTSAQFLIIH